MLKKDYLVRQLEEFGKVLAVIMGLKKQNDWDKIEKEIYDATQKFTSLEINHVEGLDAAGFETEILNHPALSPDQQKILADLLYEKLHYYLIKEDNERALKLKERCTSLYKHIQDNFTQNEFNLDVYYKLIFLSKI